MAENKTTRADEDGLSADWIEPCNTDASTVNLSGRPSPGGPKELFY